jgi:hypothetical protein
MSSSSTKVQIIGTYVPARDSAPRVDVFNLGVTANTNILAKDIVPTHTPVSYFVLYCSFQAAGTLNVKRTKAGVTVTEGLNAATDLNANAAYIFAIRASSLETINFQYTVTTTMSKLLVTEGDIPPSQGMGASLNTSPPTALPSDLAYTDAVNVFSVPQTFLNYLDLTDISSPPNPASTKGRLFIRTIDANNDGLFVRIKRNNAFQEIQIV